ncbi:unnamed protein product [Ascophyllum nodosum]
MRSTPQDFGQLAYCIFFLQGVGQLFPWNVIINAEDHFRRRFCGTVFERSFENSFAFGYNITAIVGIAIALRYQDYWNLNWRIMGSLAVSATAFGVCGMFVTMEQLDTSLLFFSTMGLILALGLAVAFLQGGLFSMAASFPPKYTQAMMAGQGLAGLAVALAGLFTTLVGPDDQSCIPYRDQSDATNAHLVQNMGGDVTTVPAPSCAAYTRDWGTLVYFAIAVVVLLGCLVTYPLLQRLPVTIFYTCAIDNFDGMSAFMDDVASKGDIKVDSMGGGDWLTGSSSTVQSNTNMQSSMSMRLVEAPPLRLLPVDQALSDSAVHQEPQERDLVIDSHSDKGTVNVLTNSFGGIQSKLAPILSYGFSVFFVFMVTLSVFPGATSLIVSSRQCRPGRARFFASDVFLLFSFVSFNAFDFLGRLAAGLSVVLPAKWLPAASVCRIVFVPLFLACRSENSRFPYHWLWADAFPLSIMPIFAFTNGYFGSLSMMAGSQKGAWAGTTMVLFLSGGLVAGSLLSFLVVFASTT